MSKTLKSQLANLQFMIDNGINTDTKKCKENYLTTTLHSIISMAISVDQANLPTEVTECKKVIKLKRMNCTIDIMRKTHPEALVFEGIYLIATGLFIPSNVMQEIGYDKINSRWGKLDLSSLPEGYAYSTIRDIGNGCGFVIKKGEIADNINNRASSWEYFSVLDYLT